MNVVATITGRLRGLSRFLSFAAIGVVGFAVDVTVLQGLVTGLGLSPFTARIFSYLAAATTTWTLNRNITFRSGRSDRLLREWLQFLATNAIGGTVNYLVYSALVSGVPVFAAHLALAVAAGSLAGLAFNYLCSARFVFNGR